MTTTLRQLEYVAAIDACGSFGGAAEACHVTQPGLSAQVRQLEDHLGLPLFERGRGPTFTTAAGAEIVGRAREILRAVNELEDAALALCRPLTGRLRLGVIPTVAPYLLPSALPAVRRAHPALRVELQEAQTADLVEGLERGQLDLLLLALEAPLGDLETHALFPDPFVLALPRGHRLASRKRAHESDLDGESVLLLDDGHCLRDQALAVCARAGASELGDFRATSLTTLVHMVAGGLGVTLLPNLALRGGATRGMRDLVTLPFAKPAPQRTVGFAWRSSSARGDEYRVLAERFGPPRVRGAR